MSQENDLEKFAKELQEQILEQIKKRYSETVIEHWQNPRNLGKMEHPDGYGQAKGSCGDTMEMYLKMKDDIIRECTFQTDGCGTTIACASLTTELAKNMSFTQALGSISANEILKRLGGLPEADVHCAQLASETFRRTLADYLYKKHSPWKKHYRKS